MSFTVLEQIVGLNVIEDNIELKINWEELQKQPVQFHKVGIFLFLFVLFFVFFLVFDFLIFE